MFLQVLFSKAAIKEELLVPSSRVGAGSVERAAPLLLQVVNSPGKVQGGAELWCGRLRRGFRVLVS